jgi:predicted ATPase
MSSGRITELRLTAFKSYKDVAFRLEPLTVLIGRNGSGKSNALDALEILSRLARGDDVRDALEGNRRDAGPVRGGLEGCAPHGTDSFEVGVTLETEYSQKVTLDVTVRVRPEVQIIAERLCAHVSGGRWRTLIDSDAPGQHRADLDATVWNGNRGRNPRLTFRSSHLLTAQLPLRFAGKSAGERELLQTTQAALAVLGGVFHLDPVPHLMRQYVAEQDVVLRRTAENLSASVARLKHDDRAKFNRLVQAIGSLPEFDVRTIEIGSGGFGDVMLALKERKGRTSVIVPARQMSDGMLRMLAIATALLTGGGGLAIDTGAVGQGNPLMLVIEELENGLHPSQAAQLLELVTSASQEQGFQVMLTTHSPALLNALPGDEHAGVIVIARERTSGLSSATRLVDLPGYTRLMATGRLGDSVAAGRLEQASTAPGAMTPAELDRMLGIA